MEGPRPAHVPFVVVLRSRTDHLRFLGDIQTGIAVTVVVAMFLATLLSYAVARTVTRPLGAITAVMREMARTGDLTRKITTHDQSWQDEDARLLASTFNTLTDSIARFEREASQRERLSSLGRLSSVVAHEIRNPLMIIKAAVRSLRQAGASSDARDEALRDIDGEVARLNRIVSEVLDYARPPTMSWADADVAALCQKAAGAVRTAEPEATVRVIAPPDPLVVTTDADRLRGVLVNVITNACQAVRALSDAGQQAGTDAPPVSAPARRGAVACETTGKPDGGVTIRVRDNGLGLDPGLVSRVFEPYFTTRRTGTGLGLAIAKNIVDGLGGTIAMTSVPGEGTEVRIDLPARPPA